MCAHRHAIISVLIFLLLVPAVASADDDASYAPEKFSVDELIVTDRFDSAPLNFPWERVSSERVPNRGRMDFALVYDVDYDTVYDYLHEAYSETEDFIELNAHAMRYADSPLLRIAGANFDENAGRITVGHPDMEPLFTVDVEPDGNRTRFIIHNMLRTRQFSGFMPSRVDFAPAGADGISFRGN